jgi:DNA-binding NtrC family response regulator
MWEKGNILVIDDDEAMRESICDQLETSGYRTRFIVKSEELFDAMDATKFNVALLSIHMFEQYGEAIIKNILEKSPELPIIAVTEFTAQELNKRILKAGVTSLLSKPFTFNNLLTEINHAMNKEEKLKS